MSLPRALLAAAVVALIAGCTSPVTAPGPAMPPAAPPTTPPATAPTTEPKTAPAPRPARLVPLAGQAPSPASGTAPAFSVGGSGASAQCLAAIEAFAERHSGNRVMLGQAAFATGDELVLTRMPHRGADGRPLDGRAPAPEPLVLRLFATPSGCMVRVVQGAAQEAAGAAPPREITLPECGCRPLRESEE